MGAQVGLWVRPEETPEDRGSAGTQEECPRGQEHGWVLCCQRGSSELPPLGAGRSSGGWGEAAWRGRHHQAGDPERPLSAGRPLLSTHPHEDLTQLTAAEPEGALCSGDSQPTSEARVELRRTQTCHRNTELLVGPGTWEPWPRAGAPGALTAHGVLMAHGLGRQRVNS